MLRNVANVMEAEYPLIFKQELAESLEERVGHCMNRVIDGHGVVHVWFHL